MSIPVQTGAHLGILAVSLAGFFTLALATERHAEHLLGRLPGPGGRRLARITGWLLLAASLAWAVAALGTGPGITLWLGWLTIAALAWVFIFPKWPWRPSEHGKPVRVPKTSPRVPVVADETRTRRRIAACLLVLMIIGFSMALIRCFPLDGT